MTSSLPSVESPQLISSQDLKLSLVSCIVPSQVLLSVTDSDVGCIASEKKTLMFVVESISVV